MATASGLNDYDYQNLSNLTLGLKNVNQLELVSKIPVPPEIMEHYNSELIKRYITKMCQKFNLHLTKLSFQISNVIV